MKRLLLATAILFWTQPVQAEFFEVEEAETEENAVELESVNTIYLSDVANGDTRSTHELGVSWGVLPGWKTGLSFEIENERGASPVFEGIEWSNTFAIVGEETIFDFFKPHPGATNDEDEESDGPEFSLAVYTAFEAEQDNNATEIALTTGPLVGFSHGPVELGLNTLLEIPLTGDGNAGFLYAASALYGLTDTVAAGVEFHGEVEDVFDNSPPLSRQMHFVGPVISTEIEVEDGREVELRFGGFIGLTRSSPDFAASLNLEIEFN